MFDEAEFVISAAQWDQLPTDSRPEVAFVGRSNVGKSSLLNALLRRKNLAYTSKTPGKTQQLNYFRVDGRFYCVDLPGYGYAKAPQSARKQWARLQDRYLAERAPLCGVVQLLDSRHPPQESDRALLDQLRDTSYRHLLALTKADKLSGNGRAKAERRVADTLADLGLDHSVLLTSATDGRGIMELRTWVGDVISDASSAGSGSNDAWPPDLAGS